jgi:hypothetical protein
VATLKRLTNADVGLVGAAKLLADECENVATDQWNDSETADKLQELLGQFKNLIQERRSLLLVDGV